MLHWLHDGIRCERIKRDGTRCKNPRVKGATVCGKHGAGKAKKAAAQAWREWCRIRPAALAAGFEDRLANAVTVPGRIVLADAWLAAQAAGDPVIYQNARRAVAARYRARLEYIGAGHLLDELGVRYQDTVR